MYGGGGVKVPVMTNADGNIPRIHPTDDGRVVAADNGGRLPSSLAGSINKFFDQLHGDDADKLVKMSLITDSNAPTERIVTTPEWAARVAAHSEPPEPPGLPEVAHTQPRALDTFATWVRLVKDILIILLILSFVAVGTRVLVGFEQAKTAACAQVVSDQWGTFCSSGG